MTTESTDTTLLGDAAQADTAAATGAAADTSAAATAQTDGATGADGKPADGAKDSDKPAGAPETYADFKMPEGVEIDKEMLGEFTPVLKELGLSQDAAQKVIDFAPKLMAKTQAAVLSQLGMADMASWAETAKTDKEFGGEKFAENLAVGMKAIEAFGSKELIALLNQTGLGNHPEMLRFAIRAGKQISADGFVSGGKTKTPEPFYGNSKMTL